MRANRRPPVIPETASPSARSGRAIRALPLLILALVLAACGSSGPRGSKASTAVKAKAQEGGTATYAEPAGSTPNYILPLTSSPYSSTANLSQFQNFMFLPLYWFGDNGKAVLDPTLSLADAPVYSDNGRTVTITLKHYKWSDGTPLTSRDVLFWMNLLKANKADWFAYVPGGFPDNVTSMTAPNAQTVVFHLNRTYSSRWFTYNELSQITPLPQQAWDKTSATSPDKGYDESPAGAKAVYKFLNAQATALHTYATNPLWKVVDGPWHLQSFSTTGRSVFVPNRSFSGPDRPHLSRFIELPFTTEAAEYDALRAGDVDVGYVPPANAGQQSALNAQGYQLRPWVIYGFNFMRINFHNPTVGPLFDQFYIRQALQRLIDQPSYVSALYKSFAVPTYGPVPLRPPSPAVSPSERTNLYPYSVSTAERLLRSHGWHLTPGKPGTCTHPGTGSNECGAGIAQGAKLSFRIQVASGDPPLQQSMQAFQSSAARAGVRLHLSFAPVDTVIANQAICTASQPSCSWEIQNFGGGWVYGPDYLPTGEELYATGAGANKGNYSNPTANRLIAATTTSSSLSALYRYEDFISKNLPVIFQPEPDSQLTEVKSTLRGVTPQNPFSFLNPSAWYFAR